MEFTFEMFTEDFPVCISEVLVSEAFDSLPALLGASNKDVESLPLKRGHIALLRDQIISLQVSHLQG